MNIPFSPPDISEAEINEVAEALRSGWITTGVGRHNCESKTAWVTTAKKNKKGELSNGRAFSRN